MTDSYSVRCGLWFQRVEVVDAEATPVTLLNGNRASLAVNNFQGNDRGTSDNAIPDEDEDVRLYKCVRLLQKSHRRKSKPPENVFKGRKGRTIYKSTLAIRLDLWII